jgi:hypothetical protein
MLAPATLYTNRSPAGHQLGDFCPIGAQTAVSFGQCIVDLCGPLGPLGRLIVDAGVELRLQISAPRLPYTIRSPAGKQLGDFFPIGAQAALSLGQGVVLLRRSRKRRVARWLGPRHDAMRLRRRRSSLHDISFCSTK